MAANEQAKVKQGVVSELGRTGETVFLCELCGLGYRDLETAERCEQYCYTHKHTSVVLARKAVYRPRKPASCGDQLVRGTDAK